MVNQQKDTSIPHIYETNNRTANYVKKTYDTAKRRKRQIYL